MTATTRRYRSPYVSQMLAEPDRTWDDCCASVTIMLAADWTLGEILIQPDGDQRNVLALRNIIRKRIGDTDGGLTFHDANQMMHELDPDLPDLPRYPGQVAKPGQSTAGATLRLDRAELSRLLKSGHSAGVCGYSGTVGHVVHVTDGDAKGVLRKDPLTRHGTGWKGDRMSWGDLWAFTEREVGGKRYGTDQALAVAVVKVGSETAAARAGRQSAAALAAAVRRIDACKARADMLQEEEAERTRQLAAAKARADLADERAKDWSIEADAAKAALAACRDAVPDCAAAEARIVALTGERDAAWASLADRAAERDAALARIERAVEALAP